MTGEVRLDDGDFGVSTARQPKRRPRFLIPGFNGAIFSHELKDAL
jgi:hypothetical protein